MPPRRTSAHALTRHQQRLLKQLRSILSELGLDVDEMLNEWRDEPDAITAHLRRITDHVVRGEILLQYTLIDTMLSWELTRHFFGDTAARKRAGKSRRFRTFRLIQQELYPHQKLRLIESYKQIPSKIKSNIMALNDLRNGVAHSFHLRERRLSQRTYKKHDVFSLAGLRVFLEDMNETRNFLMPWLKRLLESMAGSPEGGSPSPERD